MNNELKSALPTRMTDRVDYLLKLQSRNAQFCNFGKKNRRILFSVTLKLDGQPCKTTRHLLYATSSRVHHFVAICDFKLELWSGKAQIGAKFDLTPVTLTSDL